MYVCNNKCECGVFSMDSKTPYKVHLSAYYKRSFAFYTVKERMPVIITKLIDSLVREKEGLAKQYGEASKDELKSVIGALSKLKYEIQTNKPIEPINSENPDAQIYNQYLLEQSNTDGTSRFFTAIWLHAECYMYRRIRDFFENTKTLKTFDYFRKQKEESFAKSIVAISALAEYFLPLVKNPENVDVKKELFDLLKLNLWGNRCDLSISAGEVNSMTSNPINLIEKYEDCILSNDSERIWIALNKHKHQDSIRIIDFINDNAGYEIFTDFCLADFLISHGFADKICFNLKTMPWFISDTTPDDFKCVVRLLINHTDPNLKKLGIRWNKYIREEVWSTTSDSFWTLPVDFTQMTTYAPELHNRLSQSIFLIFKGDLNYRKLFGEINWEPTTPVKEALQNFCPTKLCTLRTVKADIICGLKKGEAEDLDQKDPDWMTTGHYGVIQFAE